MSAFIFVLLQLFLCSIRYGNTASSTCTQDDVKIMNMECDPKTRLRKVVSYLANDCTIKDPKLIKPPYMVPCTCKPGFGLSPDKKKCLPCGPGTFSAGGEDFSDWRKWTDGGKMPPIQSGIATFCETSRSYVPPCNHWKASFFNDSLDSGDNSKTRCMSSIFLMKKQFVAEENFIEFTYRVEGRKCYNSYAGCDGLAFYVDNKQVMPFQGNQLVWKTVRFNVTAIGTLEPNTQCQKCPAGTYSDVNGTSKCEKCDYFQYQPKLGQTSCSSCPLESYSMPGSGYCIPMLNCTKDDILMAPEPLSTCMKNKDGVFVREIKPEYSKVKIKEKKDTHYHQLCISMSGAAPSPRYVECKCQPGYELSSTTPTCKQCAKGMMSEDGRKCVQCPRGHVALMGKHYYTWDKSGLPENFTSGCAGDCPNKAGWKPSGTDIRTSRVIGDVDSFIQSDKYEIISNIAYIAFNCSILCNITEQTSRLQGNHLADLEHCNLVFEVWANGSLSDQVNCTKPKGKYVFKHERRRDGRAVGHKYNLKRGTYQFRWVFHQEDELKSISSAFEAKVLNISIFGVKGGSAIRCTPCASGSYSVDGNTDCVTCPKGTSSKSGQSECLKCKEGYFADEPGSGQCLICGATTTSLPTRDGCTSSGCKYSVKGQDIEYDFSRMSRVNGTMFTVLNYQAPIDHGPSVLRKRVDRQQRTSPARLSIWPPYRPQFYLNLCTLLHDNSSCTSRKSSNAPRESMPVMGCRASWWSLKDTSIGRVIGFKPKKDPRSGVLVELLHGDLCLKGMRYNATIDLNCDPDAGLGRPGPENNYTQIFRPPCSYYFKWNSLYACPKCRKGDLEKVTHPCVNGTALVTMSRKTPCWGPVDGMEAGEKLINCTSNDVNKHVLRVRKIIKVQQTVNKVLIGVGVVVIIALIVVAGYYFYKHRDIKFKYYHTLARNKPMSRLEEEEEDFGQVEGDVFNDTRTMINS